MKVSKLLVLAMVVGVLFMSQSVFAETPEGCNSNAVGISITPFIEGSPTAGPVEEGDVITYWVTLSVPASAFPILHCNYSGGQLSVTLPDGTIVQTAGHGGTTPNVPTVAEGSPFAVACPTNYTVTAADVAAGIIVAFADYGATSAFPSQVNGTFDDATGQNTAKAATSNALLVELPEPCIEVTKEVNCEVSKAGDEVIYTICITNCGPTMVYPTVIYDDVLGDLLPIFENSPTDDPPGCFYETPLYLYPGESCCLDFPYTILGTDPNPLVNTVIFEAVDEYETDVEAEPAQASVDLVHPCLEVVVECISEGPLVPGDTAEFKITLNNCGDVDLLVDVATSTGECEVSQLPVPVVSENPIDCVMEVLVPEDFEGTEFCIEVIADWDIADDLDGCLPNEGRVVETACCSLQELCYGDETAWAYGGSYANANWDYVNNKFWGWTNGPLSEGAYVWDVYAGAGQNDLSKGTVVGTLYVDYEDGCVIVAYEVDEGYYLGETHLWIGSTPLPMVGKGKKAEPTNSPGLFPYGVNYGFDPEDSDTWETEWSSGEICDFTGNIYVAAHAVVWMEVECPEEPEEPTIVE